MADGASEACGRTSTPGAPSALWQLPVQLLSWKVGRLPAGLPRSLRLSARLRDALGLPKPLDRAACLCQAKWDAGDQNEFVWPSDGIHCARFVPFFLS